MPGRVFQKSRKFRLRYARKPTRSIRGKQLAQAAASPGGRSSKPITRLMLKPLQAACLLNRAIAVPLGGRLMGQC
jgi:hypothetical protein